MRKFLLIASAAAMAATMPALAEKGGKGGGNGNGGGKGQAAAQGGGGGHGGGKAHKMAGGQGGHGGQGAMQAKPQKPQKAQKVERPAFNGGGGNPAKAERQAMRGGGKPAKAERQAFRNEAKRQERFVQERAQRAPFGADRAFDGGGARLATLGQSCPPGLANKNNGCLPPGQAKKVFGLGDRIQPTWFSGYQVPEQYRAFYSDTPDYYYRYNDDGYIYRVERESNLISGLVPLLGGGFAVGQPLPMGYDAYNVPYQYRDMYQDTDESYYRYGDDAIYRVDGESGIIESIVALLGGGLNVGEQLPSGYDAYNLPMDYRDDYVDGEDYNYRYADGNIYQVDTKTQIIQAIVQALV